MSLDWKDQETPAHTFERKIPPVGEMITDGQTEEEYHARQGVNYFLDPIYESTLCSSLPKSSPEDGSKLEAVQTKLPEDSHVVACTAMSLVTSGKTKVELDNTLRQWMVIRP